MFVNNNMYGCATYKQHKLTGNAIKCTNCSLYLSVPPIYLTSNGGNICGRCPLELGVTLNKSFEAIVKKLAFPCRYDTFGCQECIPWEKVAEHEDTCSFRAMPLKGPLLHTFDHSLLNDLKCDRCSKYLTVGPLSMSKTGRNICGRCLPLYEEDIKGLVHNAALESVIKSLTLPCINLDQGCYQALQWHDVAMHEETCKKRPFVCPSTPYNVCDSLVSVNTIEQHFNQCHLDSVLTNPTFYIDISVDGERNRLYKANNRLFIFFTKVDLAENRLRFGISCMNELDPRQTFKYTLKISDVSVMDEYVCKNKSLQDRTMLRLNTEKCTTVSLEGLRCHLDLPDNCNEVIFQVIIASFDMMKQASAEQAPVPQQAAESLIQCPLKTCNQIGTKLGIDKHFSEMHIGWNLKEPKECHRKPTCPLSSNHLYNCPMRTLKCLSPDCNADFYYRTGLELHKRSCKHPDTTEFTCWIESCPKKFIQPSLVQHIFDHHPEDIIEDSTFRRVAEISTDWKYFYFWCYDSLFRGYSFLCSNGKCGVNLFMCDGKKAKSKFKYEVKFLHPVNPSKSTIVVRSECDICKWINATICESFIVDGKSLTFTMTVLKKYVDLQN